MRFHTTFGQGDRNADVAGGDQADVDIELETRPREVTVPADFPAAPGRDLGAGRSFDVFSYSHK